MRAGEIYVWTTDKAVGHAERRKYHVYICDGASWRCEDHIFLFVSKSDYGGDYPLSNADYPFLPLQLSYVSCRTIATYSDNDLRSYTDMTRAGELKPEHMRGLFDAVAGSDLLAQWQIQAICNAIKVDF
jgi:hypothetical protein